MSIKISDKPSHLMEVSLANPEEGNGIVQTSQAKRSIAPLLHFRSPKNVYQVMTTVGNPKVDELLKQEKEKLAANGYANTENARFSQGLMKVYLDYVHVIFGSNKHAYFALVAGGEEHPESFSWPVVHVVPGIAKEIKSFERAVEKLRSDDFRLYVHTNERKNPDSILLERIVESNISPLLMHSRSAQMTCRQIRDSLDLLIPDQYVQIKK